MSTAFQQCFSRLPEATLLVSARGRILEANAAATEVLRPGAPLQGSILGDLILDSPDKVNRYLELCRRTRDLLPGSLNFKNGKPEGIACRTEGALFESAADGGVLLLRIFSKGEATRAFRTLNERIEALNREVMQRKRTEAALYAQQEWLRATLLSIGDAVISTDSSGNITLLNTVAELMTGWTQEEATGKPLDEIFIISNEDTGATVENPVIRVLREGKVVGLANHTRLTTRDGRQISIDDSAAPVRDRDGQLTGVVLVFRDVTELKRVESERAAAENRLRRANEDLSQFAFAASHDLQEPLRMIASYSQLLIKGYQGRVDEESALCMRFITEGTTRMRDLLADLLAYTQMNGEQVDSPQAVDLNLVLGKTLENCRAAIDETGAVVTSDPLPTVPGHEPHFLQLFQNLVSNAIKYRSGKTPIIHIAATRVDELWRLSVADNGIGIAPEYHQKIFGVFKRLHGKMIAGTGIGLAICQRVVERYHGRIWVESQVDQGSTFFFTLSAKEAKR